MRKKKSDTLIAPTTQNAPNTVLMAPKLTIKERIQNLGSEIVDEMNHGDYGLVLLFLDKKSGTCFLEGSDPELSLAIHRAQDLFISRFRRRTNETTK